ncbi:ABC-2 family transporter protein [Sinomicrobium oceani]|uniref:ABC-2 family transporter protein n=1 Tax=Sinomicrobium oceani TaxID=1150368 RepID=A0A1K1RIH5_9FLAO|nr:M1 family aminopeptidase [Sinomicrobium oceani]SFW71880.1 ABC-2 family transporter protein [Sinomicrobium oceani]
MKALLFFDVNTYSRRYTSYIVLVILWGAGIFAGMRFNLSVGEEVYLNSPYSIGFMEAMLSLSVILFATIIAVQLLFREWDSRFDIILFATPIRKTSFISARFLSFFILTFICYACVIFGFVSGQNLRSGVEMQDHVLLRFYLYPLIVFGVVNTLFTCAVLFGIAVFSRKKLLVISGGLLLYILYLVLLMYSDSPFMTSSIPQSVWLQKISAIFDPFGISAYFYEAGSFTAVRKNADIVPLTGYFLANRVVFTVISVFIGILGYRRFSFVASGNKRTEKPEPKHTIPGVFPKEILFRQVNTCFRYKSRLRAVLSFAMKDIRYMFGSMVFFAVSVLLLFYVGMEIYAAIEQGIRLPQQYADSGLMASAISDNFRFLGLWIVTYFVNDLYWRSHASGFSGIENSTFFAGTKIAGHWWSCTAMILIFSVLMIIQGLIFQILFHYFRIDWQAYLGVLVFNTFPLILFAGMVLLINNRVHHKYMALGVSVLLLLLTTGPVAQVLVKQPLLLFFSGYTLPYSDFNGYGAYMSAFLKRIVFGISITGILWLINRIINGTNSYKIIIPGILIFLLISVFCGVNFTEGYMPVSEKEDLEKAARYEQQYRKYKEIEQPVISRVKTDIALYPGQQAYTLKGHYVLENRSGKDMRTILLNFHPDLKINKAVLTISGNKYNISDKVTELTLKEPLQPDHSATLEFELGYQWFPVNGHHPFNAIVENGSFMRISRYYPQLGYQQDYEISGKNERKAYGLGKPTTAKLLEEPRTDNHFTDLNMIVSTTGDQVAVGTGELVKQWKDGGRNYFEYRTREAIPFRFAVSSAKYAVRTASYKGIRIKVLYHPGHDENVAHLVRNASETLSYCITNFGAFPFSSVTFAEVSSFTKGFAATAYPGVIFMTENMVFHANIRADRQQDVINELAGHELSHFWWGNNRIAPDYREGAAMLTETLAMYTEMMLYKKMYGSEKMQERIKVHQQIYDSQKGFATPRPLYKVQDQDIHISYAKGAVIMVRLSELIGEDKVNKALKEFLLKHRYPAKAPVSTDVIEEFLKVSTKKDHEEIRKLFEQI